METRTFVVDRVEVNVAILIQDDEDHVNVPLSAFPFVLAEGMVLKVPVENSRIDWNRSEYDAKETARRVRSLVSKRKALGRSDTGADVDL